MMTVRGKILAQVLGTGFVGTGLGLVLCGVLLQLTACSRAFAPAPGMDIETDQINFKHAPHIALRVPCSKCHAGIETSQDSAGHHQTKGHEVCKGCHTQQFLHMPSDQKIHHGLGPMSAQFEPCLFCHSQPRLAKPLPQRNHQELIFAHDKHLPRMGQGAPSDACLPCHGAVVHSKAIADDKLPTMDACLDCHQQDFNDLACSKCHVDLRREGLVPLSQYSHVGDFVRDHGPVAQRDPQLCLECHASRDCESCHDTRRVYVPSLRDSLNTTRPYMHRGNWMTRHGAESTRSPVACLRCHQDQACQTCHEAAGLRRTASHFVSPHPQGWALDKGSVNHHGRVAAAQIYTCMACHDGDRPGRAGTNCVLCHADRVDQPGGNPHPPGFRSVLDPLTHPACRDCHRR